MPVSPTYPGVYIVEVPSGVRTITGVSTSTAAFVDSFERGLLNTPVRVLSFADFEREFGGLQQTSPASYGIQQFFLNGGQQAYVVRVATGAFSAATTTLRSSDAVPVDLIRAFAGRRFNGESESNPGEWGNALRLDIDFNTGDPATVFSGAEAAQITSDELFNLTVIHSARERGRFVVLAIEVHSNVTLRTGVSRNVIEVVNEASQLIQLAPDDPLAVLPPNSRPQLTGTVGANLPAPDQITTGELAFTVTVGAISKTVSLSYPAEMPHEQLRPILQNAIRAAGAAPQPVPMLSSATVQLLSDVTSDRFRIQGGRNGIDFDSNATITFADEVGSTAATELGLADAIASPQLYSLATGDNGEPADATALLGDADEKTGMHALTDVDLFNILCIPKAADLDQTDMQAVYAAANALCLNERAFLLVDMGVEDNSINAAETWLTDNVGLRERNAAVYFPRVQVPDPLNEFRLKSCAPSGTIAGLMARTDSSRGVWKAPAGTEANLRGVSGLQVMMNDAENGVLNPLAVNALRVFPNGIVSWGARTLVGFDNSGQDDNRYVPVRRFQLFLEESLYRGLQFAVFEPNDEPLWAQIRLAAGAFMNNLFRQGAFQGLKSSDAYFVKCDSETTTQNHINLGIVNVYVGFAPLKPAEFVILHIQQRAGQVQT